MLLNFTHNFPFNAMKNIIVLILLAVGCRTSNVEPAPPTDNEKFYCEVDGERYRPNNKGDIFNEVLIADWYKSKGTFTVSAYNSVNYKDILMYVNLKGKNLSVNKHLIDTVNVRASYYGGYTQQNGISTKSGYFAIINSGLIEITKVDTLKKKVSGKFEFDAQSRLDKTKIVKIRNGQFNDLTY